MFEYIYIYIYTYIHMHIWFWFSKQRPSILANTTLIFFIYIHTHIDKHIYTYLDLLFAVKHLTNTWLLQLIFFIYIYIYIYIYICIYRFMYTYTYVFIYSCLYIHVYTWFCWQNSALHWYSQSIFVMYIYIYIYIYMYLYICIYIYMYIPNFCCRNSWYSSRSHSQRILEVIHAMTIQFMLVNTTGTANPTWGVIFESSNLKARTSTVDVWV